VQDARLRRYRRSGAGPAELRCGDGLLLLMQLDVVLLVALLLLLLFSSSSSAGAATAEGEKLGLLGFRGRLGLLYATLGFGERLRQGILDVRDETRGGIAVVRRSSVADTGGAAVSLPCCEAGTSGARRRAVMRASGGRGGREKRKRGAAVRRLSRGGASGARPGELRGRAASGGRES
jgi:hypothetical protein